ncbi:MAG: mechanosensitive ion channel family protein [Halanaerobiales bacterium]|nr:mechanosensitive ion channel family protein [Halanaerobiales bacterium]
MGNDILQAMVLENTIYDYLISIIIIVVGLVLIRLIKYILLKRVQEIIKRFSINFSNFVDQVLNKRVLALTNIIIVYIAVNRLTLNYSLKKSVDIIFILFIVFYTTLLIQDIIIYTIKKYWEKKESNQAQETVLTVTVFVIKLISWTIALLFVLDNLNIEIRGLITGLGIGGIALAFAAQTILADIFSYFTIFLDRPFDIGDFIIIGDYKGSVEHIGIKTTRVRSLSGEQLVFSNNDLTNSRINNYKRMNRRRANFNFGVIYDTELDKLKKIPDIVKDIITNIEQICFDRAHFASYGEYSLIYQVVYYVENKEYLVYMDKQQKINLELKKRFKEEGIEFAYPTQSIHVYDQITEKNIEPINS